MNDLVSKYQGPLRVTICYISLYYIFIIIQVSLKYYAYFQEKSKNDKIKLADVKYNTIRNPLVLTGDRSVGNTLEQAIPFLVSLWLHAIFVDTEYATYVGSIYVLTRSFYPVVFRLGAPFLFFSTIPNYICIAMLLMPVGRLVF
jgi:hypothetical protein